MKKIIAIIMLTIASVTLYIFLTKEKPVLPMQQDLPIENNDLIQAVMPKICIKLIEEFGASFCGKKEVVMVFKDSERLGLTLEEYFNSDHCQKLVDDNLKWTFLINSMEKP